MCGLCGIINFSGEPIKRDLIQQMNNTLIHRGPDDEGYYFNHIPETSNQQPTAALAHRRLSIIDLKSGHQPMSNEDNTSWIVFNGEIYNFLDLTLELKNKGHLFKTRSDTEAILHAYEEWGEECVHRLRGMFAFAIWDDREKKLILARDRIGIKPLYYYLDNKRLIFASEIKAILTAQVKREINLEALSDYLSLLYIPAPKTIFKNIYKLPPGHILVCSPQGIKIKEYWDISFAEIENKPEPYFTEKLRALLTQAVNMRLISEVPLGAFLSGGVDSSCVVAIMANLLKEPVITNSIGFKEKKFNELEYAREIAHLFNTNHHEYVVTPDALSIIDKLAYHYDEPFADSSAIPTYYVSKMTKQNVIVALSGDGGDENFAGYRRYFYDRLENRLRKILPNTLRKTLIAGLAQIYPKADWLPQIFRAKSFLTNLSLPPHRAFFYSVSQLLPGIKEKLLNKEVVASLKGYDTASLFETYFNKVSAQTNDSLSRVQYIDMKTYLVDDILTKVDRASMANSLEVRVPLLDHKFMEFVATLPSHLKLKGRETKYILKKAMNGILPDKVFNRKKMGFVIPINIWFKNEIKDFTQDTLFSKSARQRGLFNYKFIEKIWKEHQSGLKDHTSTLWALLMFEKWHETWFAGR